MSIDSHTDQDLSDKETIAETYDTDRILDELNRISRDDFAGFFLMDALVTSTQMASLFDTSLRVVSADKKGNIMYVRVHTQVALASDEAGPDRYLTLDQEIFFIGTGTGGIVIRTAVPSIGFDTDAYAWTQGWLNSLRVPFRSQR